MMVQEVRENLFTDFDKLPAKVRRRLEAKTCTNCDVKLKPKGGEFINYVLSDKGRVVWWHDARCVSLEEERRHALLAYKE